RRGTYRSGVGARRWPRTAPTSDRSNQTCRRDRRCSRRVKCSSRRSAWPYRAPSFEVLDEPLGRLTPTLSGKLAVAYDRRYAGRLGFRDSLVNRHARTAPRRVQLDGHHDVYADRPVRYLRRRGRLVIGVDEREGEAQPGWRDHLVEDALDRHQLARGEAMMEAKLAAGARIHLAPRNLDAVRSEPTREVLRHGPGLEHELAWNRELAVVEQVASVFCGAHRAPPSGAARAAPASTRRGGRSSRPRTLDTLPPTRRPALAARVRAGPVATALA